VPAPEADVPAEPAPDLQARAESVVSGSGFYAAAAPEGPRATPAPVDPGAVGLVDGLPGAFVPSTGAPVSVFTGYPLPRPAPRRRFGIGFLAGFLTATTLALLIGCGIAVVTSAIHRPVHATVLTAGRTATPTGLPSGSAFPSPTPSGTIHSNDLASYAVPVPPNSRPWRTKPTDEPLNFDQTAALAKDPTVRAEVLRRYDFQRAFARHWISSTRSIVEDRLYQFPSTTLAAEFYQEDVLLDSAGSWGTASDVAGVPGGKAFVKSAVDANGYQGTLSMGLSGDIVVCIFAEELAPADSTVANQLLADQYARL